MRACIARVLSDIASRPVPSLRSRICRISGHFERTEDIKKPSGWQSRLGVRREASEFTCVRYIHDINAAKETQYGKSVDHERPTSCKRHPAETACAINTESNADDSRYGRYAPTRISVVGPINPLFQLSLHYVTYSQRNRDHRCASEVLLARRLFARN